MYDILITGGSGFIGSGILEKFKKKKNHIDSERKF